MGKKIIFRRFRMKDVTRLHNLTRKVILKSLATCYSREVLEFLLRRNDRKNILRKSKNRIYFVAEEPHAKKIVGAIAFRSGDITFWGVDPAWQKRGVGKKLFQKVLSYARKKSITMLTAAASPIAVPAYIHCGFHKGRIESEIIEGTVLRTVSMTYLIRRLRREKHSLRR